MKKFILATVVMAMGLFACAQTPPKQVSDAFNKKFSKTSEVKWEQENQNEWEAEFLNDGISTSANFSNDGEWHETEFEVSLSDVPADVFKAIALAYNGWEFEEVESVETPTFKGYEIELEKEDTSVEILVTAAGEITIKKVVVEDDDDEDDEHED